MVAPESTKIKRSWSQASDSEMFTFSLIEFGIVIVLAAISVVSMFLRDGWVSRSWTRNWWVATGSFAMASFLTSGDLFGTLTVALLCFGSFLLGTRWPSERSSRR